MIIVLLCLLGLIVLLQQIDLMAIKRRMNQGYPETSSNMTIKTNNEDIVTIIGRSDEEEYNICQERKMK